MIRERIIRPQKSSFRQSESDGQEGSCHFSNESESYYHEAATGFEKWRVQVSYRHILAVFFQIFCGGTAPILADPIRFPGAMVFLSPGWRNNGSDQSTWR
jgi:hypothetical protein